MPSQKTGTLRRFVPALFVLVLVAASYWVARLPAASAAVRAELADRYAFTELPIALPPGVPDRTVRVVNPKYQHIRSWISSVGAAAAVNDLDDDGLANDLCLVDPRSDTVIVTPAPTGGARYAPFVLDPAPLPTGPAIAPMGCAPGDFNGDGRMDALVYYWGRTPVLFLHRAGATVLDRGAFVATELVPQAPGADGLYHGPLWNTNAVSIADFDGDGHPDIGIFNYFPDTQVLDPQGAPNVVMNHSMSRAENAGGAHVLRWTGATAGEAPTARYVEQVALDPSTSTGWTLGAASVDLDGDLLPELYLANDFGKDRFFHNVSTPGRIKFRLAEGRRDALTPKSMVLGHDSFKGMGIEFADLEGRGRFDGFVSNITESWGLEESNFLWRNTAADPAAARRDLENGIAPFRNEAAKKNVAWVGWGWDAKAADFDNSGNPVIVQSTGFVKGTINRFNWLQELAMSNDLMLQEPDMWPKAEPGDDIAGANTLAFWVREDNGRYADLSRELGMAVQTPTRGVGIGDTEGNGSPDFVVARQWGPPAFYRNDRPAGTDFLGLRLYRPASGGPTPAATPGTPAYGAQVSVTTADGRVQVAQLDGGGGHSGKRSFDLHFGLGEQAGQPIRAEIRWRAVDGTRHTRQVQLTAGWHDFVLTDTAQEVTK